jgi:hypothetical protein
MINPQQWTAKILPLILQDCHLYFSGREYTRYEEYDETSEE